jgi:nucleoside triphosphate diphosphatase
MPPPIPEDEGVNPAVAAPGGDLESLRRLVRRLRAPDGCPWDRKQRLADLRTYLLEEAHEVAAAIDGGDWTELAEELGDLLFQVAFVGVLGEEEGEFDLKGVATAIEVKMIERHPHVFGDAPRLADAGEVVGAWEKAKRRKKRALAGDGRPASQLAGVPGSLPALAAAYRLGQKAAGVGFDWPDTSGVLAKVHEELAELEAEMNGDETRGPDEGRREALEAEVGDLLFAVANLARHLAVDPESALSRGNRKFRRRFAAVEDLCHDRGLQLESLGLAELDALWDEVKAAERQG